jgi:hypothetical protein
MLKVGDYVKVLRESSKYFKGAKGKVAKIKSIDIGTPYPFYVEYLDKYTEANCFHIFREKHIRKVNENEALLYMI